MVSNCRKNIMGTVSFDGKFSGMRKPQDFIVYPMGDSGEIIRIQSDTRFGQLNLADGRLILSASHSGGSNSIRFAMDLRDRKATIETIPTEELQILRQWIKSTGGLLVGNSIVKCDNTGAMAL